MNVSIASQTPTTALGNSEAAANPQRTHVIEHGDSLPDLAQRYQTTTSQLQAHNPQVLNPEVLYPGEVLNLPPEVTAPEVMAVDAVSLQSESPACGSKDTFYDKITRLAQLGRYVANAQGESPTFAKVMDQAMRDGISIQVLPDCEYNNRFPDTAGITFSDGRVYVPQSAIENGGTGALEHELMHGVLFNNSRIFDPNIAIDQRVQEAREMFEQMGLDPEDGARLVDVFERNGESHHVQTRVLAVDMSRERAGLPPLTSEQRDALYTAVSNREAALNVQRWIADEIGQGRSPEEVYREAEARWVETGVGTENRPSGGTWQARSQSLEAILSSYADEAPIQEFER